MDCIINKDIEMEWFANQALVTYYRQSFLCRFFLRAAFKAVSIKKGATMWHPFLLQD